MCNCCTRTKINESQRNCELHYGIEARNLYMTNFQFIRHQLICMFAMCLSLVLMKHNAVADCQATIHTIDKQEYQICHISSH